LLLKKPDLSPSVVSPESDRSRQKRSEGKRSEENLTPSAPNAKIAFTAEGAWENISPRQRDVWERAYPALSLDEQLAAAAAWLIANPNNRKSNYARYLNGWLQRAQDRAPRKAHAGAGQKIETDR
jgi:cytoskeletal protein RodZ